MDKNDSPPTFRDVPLVFSVSEDLAVGQTVAQITATDPDTLGTLEYSLVKGDTGKFLLEKSTGLLKLRDALDRETEDTYRLVVSVTDGVQSTETTVTVQVSPSFTIPAAVWFSLRAEINFNSRPRCQSDCAAIWLSLIDY